jgi:glycosyltransferase involved in cell wall biosynthesis
VNLLVVIYSLDSGGAERVTANLVNAWATNGWKVTVVTLKSSDQDFYDLHPDVTRLTLSLAKPSQNHFTAALNNLKRLSAMRQVLREVRPDIAIGMMTSAGVLLTISGLFMSDTAKIVCEHTYPPQLPVSPTWSRIRRLIYPLANCVTMLTNEGLRWLQSDIPRARGAVIPNPIPYPLPIHRPHLAPESIIPPERRILLAVGRLSEEKNVASLIQAFSKIASQQPEWDLVILGDGPLRAKLVAQIQSIGLGARILMPGRAGNVGDWYERADIYAMSSRVEGFPNTLGEAMAHGCAVVSFDCDTGPRDLIRHEIDGLLVPPGDVDALAQALARLMNDPALRERFAARAVEVRERYSMSQVLSLWKKLFDSIRAQDR